MRGFSAKSTTSSLYNGDQGLVKGFSGFIWVIKGFSGHKWVIKGYSRLLVGY